MPKKELELDTTLRNVILVGLTMGVMPRDRARNETVRFMPGQKYGQDHKRQTIILDWSCKKNGWNLKRAAKL